MATFGDPEIQAEYDEARASGFEYECKACGARQWWYGYTCVGFGADEGCGARFTLRAVPIQANDA